MNPSSDKNKKNIQELLEHSKFYFLNGKYEEALKVLRKLLKICPDNPDVYYNLGIIYESKNQIDTAVQMYTKALELSPEHKFAREHLDKLVGL